MSRLGKHYSMKRQAAITRLVISVVVILIVSMSVLSALAIFSLPNNGTVAVSKSTVVISSSGSTNSLKFTNQSVVGETSCVISGQPGGMFLGIFSDSDLKPVEGAQVTATNIPAYCDNSPATSKMTTNFTTAGIVWIELPSENNAGYSFSVRYSNNNFNFNASLSPVSITCAALFVPSGRTSVVSQFADICPFNQIGLVTSTVSSTTTANNASFSTFQSDALANITIPGFPGDIGIDANAGKIYVSDLFANKLTVLNSSSNTILDSIALPTTSFSEIAIDQQRDIVYVPVIGCTNLSNVSNSCSSVNASTAQLRGIVEINGSTDKIFGKIPIFTNQIAFNSVTGLLYGITFSNLLIIDPRSSALIANISLGAEHVGLALDTLTNMVYVDTCQMSLACGNAQLLMINGTTHEIQSNVSLSFFDAINFPLAVDSKTDTIYVLGELPTNLTLYAINGTSGQIEYSSKIGSSCSGAGGGSMVLDAQSQKLYAAFARQSFFLMIDTATGQPVKMITGGNGDQDVAFNPLSNLIYLTPEPQGNNGSLIALPGFSIMKNTTGVVNNQLLQTGMCLP